MDFAEKLPAISLKEAKQLIKANLIKQRRTGGQPIFLIGTPGRGKSTLMKEIAQELSLTFFDVNLGAVDEAFFTGVPFVTKEGKTVWSSPPFVSEVNKRAEENDVLVFLDDFHLVSPDVQKALMELLTARRLSGHKIADNIYFVVAGNFSGEAGAQVIFSPVFNRLKPVKLSNDKELVFEEFISFIEENGLIEELSLIGLAFVESSPEVLVEEERVGVFGSLRSVTDLLRELRIVEENYDKGELLSLVKPLIYASVREGADSFYQFYSLSINFKEELYTNPSSLVLLTARAKNSEIPIYSQIIRFVIKRLVRNWKRALYTGRNLKENWGELLMFVENTKKVLAREHVSALTVAKEGVYTLYEQLFSAVKEISEKATRRELPLERMEEIRKVYKELTGKETDKPLSDFLFNVVAEIEIPFVVSGNKVERRPLKRVVMSDAFKEKLALW